MPSRTLEELIAPVSAWTELLERFERSPHDVSVIAADERARAAALLAAQVTTRSPLGALAWNCGAVTIDHGWVRMVGAGIGDLTGVRPARLLDIHGGRQFGGMVVALDVVGGRFAIHGGGLDDVPLGEVVYWGPDTLRWAPTGLGHSALIDFLLSDRLHDFYADLHWPGWQTEVALVPLDHGLGAYPPPWSREGRDANVSRRAVPLPELWAFAEETARQIAEHGDGESISVTVDT